MFNAIVFGTTSLESSFSVSLKQLPELEGKDDAASQPQALSTCVLFVFVIVVVCVFVVVDHYNQRLIQRGGRPRLKIKTNWVLFVNEFQLWLCQTATAGYVKITSVTGLEQINGYCGYTADNSSSEPDNCTDDDRSEIGFEGTQAYFCWLKTSKEYRIHQHGFVSGSNPQ